MIQALDTQIQEIASDEKAAVEAAKVHEDARIAMATHVAEVCHFEFLRGSFH